MATKLQSMQNVHIFQSSFLLRSTILPGDILLSKLLPHIQVVRSKPQGDKIAKISHWLQCVPQLSLLTTNKLNPVRYTFLQDNFLKLFTG